MELYRSARPEKKKSYCNCCCSKIPKTTFFADALSMESGMFPMFTADLHKSCFLRTCSSTHPILGGGFRYLLFSSPTWGNDPIWRSYFSNGLKPPTSIELARKLAEKFIDPRWSYLQPASTRICVPVRNFEASRFELLQKGAQPNHSWWSYQLIVGGFLIWLVCLHLTWKLFFLLHLEFAAVVFLGYWRGFPVFPVSVVFPEGSWLMEKKSGEKPADVVDILLWIIFNMGVSKNWGTPKWMVYKGKPY